MEPTTSASTAPHPRRTSFDALALWALTITASLAAVVFIPSAGIPFIYSKVSVLALGGLVALAFYVLARLTRGNIIVPPMALVGAFWLVPLAYALSSLFSGVGIMAGLFGNALETDTLGFMIILASFASLVALTFRRSSQYRIFFKAALIVLGLVLAAQIVFLIIGNTSESLSATANLVGSFADLGMLLGLGVALILLAFRFLELDERMVRVLWAIEGLSLLMLALVNSRLVWVLVSLVALGLFIEAIMRRQGTSNDDDLEGGSLVSDDVRSLDNAPATDPHGLAAPLVTLVAALFFVIGGSTIGTSLANTLGVSYLDVRPSWQATFDVGSHTYAASPLFGSGPGSFVSEWLKFKDRALNETVFWNVDFTSGIGLIPTSFITTGIAGALAWLAFIGIFLYVGIRFLLFRAPEEAFARYVSIATFVGTIYVLALAVFSVPGPVVLIAGFFLAGLFASSLRYGGTRRERGIIFSRNPRVGFIIVFVLTLLLLASVVTAYVVIERYLADVSYQKGTAMLADGDLAGADAAARRSLVFAASDRAYQLAAAVGIANMNRIAADTTLAPSEAQQQFQASLSSAIQASLAATQLRPDNYQNWVALGNVYQTVVPLRIEGAYENAKAAYERAVELNPTNPTLPFVMAQLEIARGNGQAAEAELVKAIGLKRDYTQAIFLLSQLEVQLGKAREALQAAEAAAYFAPNDPVVLFQVGILRSGTGDVDGSVQALSRAVELNPQYANARFFLAVSYATKGAFDQALAQLNAVAALSPENAAAVDTYITALAQGRNPFPRQALSIPPPVTDTPQTRTGQ
ncbi:MAG TPA: tetratricopeptide repeat protein [Candidatus Paceibacterota bacterium]|jgi:tetratricopeptide (TPR) repeat protein